VALKQLYNFRVILRLSKKVQQQANVQGKGQRLVDASAFSIFSALRRVDYSVFWLR